MGEKKLQHRFNLWSGKKEGNRSQMKGRIRIRMNVLELTWHWSICCRLWPSDSRALAWGNNGSRVWTQNSVRRNVHIAYLLGQNCFRCNYHITRDRWSSFVFKLCSEKEELDPLDLEPTFCCSFLWSSASGRRMDDCITVVEVITVTLVPRCSMTAANGGVTAPNESMVSINCLVVAPTFTLCMADMPKQNN